MEIDVRCYIVWEPPADLGGALLYIQRDFVCAHSIISYQRCIIQNSVRYHIYNNIIDSWHLFPHQGPVHGLAEIFRVGLYFRKK